MGKRAHHLSRAGELWRLALLLLTLGVAAAGCSVEEGARRARPDSAARADVDMRVVDSIVRLQPTTRVDQPGSDVTSTASIALEAARGEVEGAQLIAMAASGSPRVVLGATDLSTTSGERIPSRNVHVWLAQPLRVERGSPAGRSGTYVDPLVPAAHRAVVLAPNRRLIAWADVYVPVDAAPGTYAGAIELRAATRAGRAARGDDGLLASVAVTVVVRRATLPDRPTLGSSIGVDASQIIRFEGVKPGSAALRRAVDAYARVLAQARLSIADVSAFVPETSRDETYLRRIFNRRGVASVRIPFYMDSPFADPLGADRAAALAYLRRGAAWARGNGWIDRAYIYAIDEPADAMAGDVRELHDLIKQADPALRLLVTRERSARAFAGSVDIWTPNISARRLRIADVAAARRAGQSTWWYPSITTWQPLPDLFVDELRPAPRALGWLAWRYDIDGLLYWSATHWHEVEDPYRDSATYKETDAVGNGDGVLLYPGRPVGHAGVPSPSVRLLQLRDGIEDHDLFTMARCAATKRDRALLDAAVARIAPSMTRFATSPGPVREARRAAFVILDSAADAGRWDPSSRATPRCV